MIYPRTEVRNRRMKVSTLIAKGYSPGEVADVMGIAPETVYNDVRFIRSGRNPELVANSARQRLVQLQIDSNEIRKEHWKIVDTGKSDYVKYLALKELRQLEQMMLDHAGRIEQALKPPVEPPSMDGSGPQGVRDVFRRRYEAQMAEEEFLDNIEEGNKPQINTDKHGLENKEETNIELGKGSISRGLETADTDEIATAFPHNVRSGFAMTSEPGDNYPVPRAGSVKTRRNLLPYKRNKLQEGSERVDAEGEECAPVNLPAPNCVEQSDPY